MTAAPPDYLEKILNARVYDVAEETPLDPAPGLSGRIHNTLLLKRVRSSACPIILSRRP